ncbi:MAG: cupin domain-containing protein [Dehalococcoidia bacterium]
MQVAKASEAQDAKATGSLFMGEVNRGVSLEQGTERLRIGLVKFSPGGRTKWHTHDFEQGLIIVAGKGIVATEDEEHVVEAGDVVVVKLGEKHWHGATEHTHMHHFSIGVPNGTTTELEPVDEIKTKNP